MTDNLPFEIDNDIIFMSCKLYKFFFSKGKIGLDAKTMYEHYMFTARMQHTNCIKATGTYMRKGLGWGKDKFDKIKKFLIEHNLIKNVCRKNEKGKVVGWYVEVRTTREPKKEEKEAHYPQNPEGGNDHQVVNRKQMLELKSINALSNNINSGAASQRKTEHQAAAAKEKKSNLTGFEEYFSKAYKNHMEGKGIEKEYIINFGRDRKAVKDQKLYETFDYETLFNLVDAWFAVPESERKFHPLTICAFANGVDRVIDKAHKKKNKIERKLWD